MIFRTIFLALLVSIFSISASADDSVYYRKWIIANYGNNISGEDAAFVVRCVTSYNQRYVMHRPSPELIMAIIATESAYNRKAISNKGAKGLMQVMWSSHRKQVDKKTLYSIPMNIFVGMHVYHTYLEMYGGNKRRALMAYYGSTNAAGQQYSDKIIATSQRIRHYVAMHKKRHNAIVVKNKNQMAITLADNQ